MGGLRVANQLAGSSMRARGPEVDLGAGVGVGHAPSRPRLGRSQASSAGEPPPYCGRRPWRPPRARVRGALPGRSAMVRNVLRVGVLALAVFTPLAIAGCGTGMEIAGEGVVEKPNPVVAFLTDRAHDGHDELYVCNADGGSRRKVSGATGIGFGVTVFAWSPDRTWIAFLDDKTFPGLHDLYVVDPLGGSPALISGPTTFGKDFTSIRWSPD